LAAVPLGAAATIVVALIPDYFSLLKGRWFISKIIIRPTIGKISAIVVIDAVSSLFISMLSVSLLIFIHAFSFNYSLAYAFESTIPYLMYSYKTFFLGIPFEPTAIMSSVLFTAFLLSTLMTSVWTAVTLCSCLLAKAMSSVHGIMRVARWMFDVEAHPVKVLGIMAATVVWLGSALYAVL
jgi:hypothetical protein